VILDCLSIPDAMLHLSLASFGADPSGGDRHGEDQPAPRAKNPAPIAVLVVDDERLIRWSLRTALTKAGYDVVEAATGAQALGLIADDRHRFAVAILDYRLPDRRDLSLLRDVRRLLPDAIVLMMTAFGDDDMRVEARALGVRAVVDKPFQVAAVVALVDASLVS
jgi:DNA-binding NtrC family response regulator